jgi:hypothetical protein
MSSNMNRFTFKPEINTVCSTLLNEHQMPQPQQTAITGIQNFGTRTGFITKKQIKYIGSCSKQYIQNGVFVKHNWW